MSARERLIAAAQHVVQVAGVTPGSRFMRRGRFAVRNTSIAGTLIYAHVSIDLRSIGITIGPQATLLANANVPPSMVSAWQGGDSTETESDPSDAPVILGVQ